MSLYKGLLLRCDQCGVLIFMVEEKDDKNPRDIARAHGLPVRHGPGYSKGRDLCATHRDAFLAEAKAQGEQEAAEPIDPGRRA